jgi:hypothetical protein
MTIKTDRVYFTKDTESRTPVYSRGGTYLGRFDFCTDSRVWVELNGCTDNVPIGDCMVEVPTTVIFRKFPEGDIIAIMPDEPFTTLGNDCMSYQHIGQHGGCSGWIDSTAQADEEGYADLLAELQQIGYNVRVMTYEGILQADTDARAALNSAQSAFTKARTQSAQMLSSA